MIPLLMTRPLAAAERFVADLPETLGAGLQVTYAPLIEIRTETGPIQLEGAKGVIFTSQNGVVAASHESAERLPAYCVGTRTAQAARAEGWNATCCGTCADELVGALLRQRPKAPLVHLRGSHARGAIAQRLTQGGLDCGEVTVYFQELLPPSAEMQELLATQKDVIMPLFSPRTAQHFASLCGDAGNLHIIALSEAVAAPLKSLNCKSLRVSKAPDAKAMIEAVRDAAAQLTRLEGQGRAE